MDKQVNKCQPLFQKCLDNRVAVFILKVYYTLREKLSRVLTVRHFPLGLKPSTWSHLPGEFVDKGAGIMFYGFHFYQL